MTTWFTSDTHYGHFNIVRFQKRPFLAPGEVYEIDGKPGYGKATITNMDEQMIARHNQRVDTNDIVYHTGDFAFLSTNKAAAILERLNGNIVLICGNHDSKEIRKLPHWAEVRDYMEIDEDGHRIVLSHYAFLAWNKAHRGSLNFHGHSHGSIKPTSQRVDIGVDCWDYRPVSLDEILRRLAKAPKHVSADYHGRE